ncbi:hypothetical protein EHI8A_017460 [Entamoeba histolytica HM-1:IMSS-B]|nr:hypothetical protein EHI8A_017460 [Entamoeba histolytica HM-1:IMSS-B]
MLVILYFLLSFVNATLFQLNEFGSMEKFTSGQSSHYLAQNLTNIWAFSNEKKYDFVDSRTTKFLITSVNGESLLLFNLNDYKFYYIQYSCPKTISTETQSISGTPLFLRNVGTHFVLAMQESDVIYFHTFNFTIKDNSLKLNEFKKSTSFSLTGAKKFKYINCDSDSFCIIYTQTDSSVVSYVVNNLMTESNTIIIKENGYCTTQNTPPLSTRKNGMECVSKDSLTVTGINPISFSTGFSEEPISAVVSMNNDDPIFIAFSGKKAYSYQGKFQVFTREYEIGETVIAAVDHYALTYSGIRSFDIDYQLLSFKSPDPPNAGCSVEPIEIVYNVPALVYHPSTIALTQLYPNDCIKEVFIDTNNDVNLNEQSLAEFDFQLNIGKTMSIPLTNLYSQGLLKINKEGKTYQNALQTAYGMKKIETKSINGMYLYFMVNWTTTVNGKHKQIASIVNNNKILKLKGTSITYKINAQKYKINIISEQDQLSDASFWKNLSFDQYASLININTISNKYLVQRIVAQYWSLLTNKYDTLVSNICIPSSITKEFVSYPGVCSETTYQYSLSTLTGIDEETPNCCGTSSCNERELETVTCQIQGSDVYSSTLYKLALQKKYDFINEYQCRKLYFNGELNAIGYGNCIYSKFEYLINCEEKGITSECAKTMFSSTTATTSVESKEVLSDSGEEVTVSSVTSDSTTSDNVVSTPDTLNVTILNFKVQNILNSQNDDPNQDNIIFPVDKSVTKRKRRKNNLPPRLKFNAHRRFTSKKGDSIDLPSIDLGASDDDGSAFLVGDGLTIGNQEYITDDFTVCVEVNDYCSQQLDPDQQIDLVFVRTGVNEDDELVVLDSMTTPDYLNNPNTKKVCNRVSQPGTVYPVVTQIPPKNNVNDTSPLSKIIIGILSGIFVIAFCIISSIIIVILIRKQIHQRRLRVINEAFQEDSISDL